MKNTRSTGLSKAQVKTIRDAAKKRERLDNDKFEEKTAAAQLVKDEKRAALLLARSEKSAAAQLDKDEKRAALLLARNEKSAAAQLERAAAKVLEDEKRAAAKAVKAATLLKEKNERLQLALERGAELQRQRHVEKQAKEAAAQAEIDDGILKDADYEHQVTHMTARDKDFVVQSQDLPDVFGLIYEDIEEEERQETPRMFDLISAYEAWTLTELESESESESESEPEPEPDSNKECPIMNGKKVRKCHCRLEKNQRLVKDQPDVDWNNTKWFWSCHCLARQMAYVDVSDDEADEVNSSDEEFVDDQDDQPVVRQSILNPTAFKATRQQKKFFKRCSASARKRARVCEPAAAAAETWTYNSWHGVARAVDNLGFIMLTDVDSKFIEFRIQHATQTSSNGVFQCQNWHAEYSAIKAQWDQFLHPDNPHVAQNTLFYMQDLSHWYQCDTRPHTLNPMRARYALPRAKFACESDAIISSCPDLA
jgi:hypothetical protein